MKRTFLNDVDFLNLCNTLRRRRGELRGASDSEIAARMIHPKSAGGTGCDAITANHVARARRAIGWAKQEAPRKEASASLKGLITTLAETVKALQALVSSPRKAAKRPSLKVSAETMAKMRQRFLSKIDAGPIRHFRHVEVCRFLRTSGTMANLLLDHLVACDEIQRHETNTARKGKPLFVYTRNRRTTGLNAPLATAAAI